MRRRCCREVQARNVYGDFTAGDRVRFDCGCVAEIGLGESNFGDRLELWRFLEACGAHRLDSWSVSEYKAVTNATPVEALNG